MNFKSYSIIGLLFAAALASCSQLEEQIPTENEYTYTFKVADDAVTKASYGEDHIVFEKDDLVASYALTSLNKSTPVEVAESGEKIITVRSSVALNAGDKVYAYYPHSSANDKASSTDVTLEIPRNQVSGDADAMPMVALPFTLTDAVNSYENTEVGTLEFVNLGSVIKLNIYSSDSKFQGETIENVTFIEEKPVAGSFTYNITDVNAENPAAISGYTETDVVVTGRATVGTSADDAGVYYMVVAPGKYKGKFVVRTNKADYTYDSSAKEREYSRATVKPLNINLASTNWVANDKYDTSIDSPRELVAFLKGTSADDTAEYTISANLDMTGYTITSASGFGGSLDGKGYSISNLTSSVPLFTENKGTLSNITLDESCVFTAGSNVFAPFVKNDNAGTYNSLVNKASVTYKATANVETYVVIAGLVAYVDGATFNNCENLGVVTFDATGKTHQATSVGGIAGFINGRNSTSTFNKCINDGPLTIKAKYGNPRPCFYDYAEGMAIGINIGGIAGCAYGDGGASVNHYFKECYNNEKGVLYLLHTETNALTSKSETAFCSIAGILGAGSCGTSSKTDNFNKCRNYALLKADCLVTGSPSASAMKYRNYFLAVGGIAGYSWDHMGGMASCQNHGNIEVEYHGTDDSNAGRHACIGGIAAMAYKGTGTYANYCKMTGDITVKGKGSLAVGGIFGFNGKQIKNEVTADCTIDVTGLKCHVGGLVGYLAGNAQYNQIKGCTSAATVIYNTTDASADGEYASLGGLIGRWEDPATGNYSCLVNYNSDPCKFTGSVSSNNLSVSVGAVIGVTNNSSQAKTFGSSEYPIKVSGTLQKKGTEKIYINSTNIDTYAIGRNEGNTTIYVEAIPAFTVMSLNLRESNLTTRMPAIVEMIKGEKPDILGLQEVKVLEGWDAFFESDSWKEVLNGVDDLYDGYRPTGQTNGILYNPDAFEMSDEGMFYLGESHTTSGTSNSWDDYQRTVVYATMKHNESGKYIFFMNTHYPLNWDGCAKSTALIDELLPTINPNNYPIVILGDFNCTKSSKAFDLWEKEKKTMRDASTYAGSYYSDANKGLYTYNAYGDTSEDRYKVDHIWYSHPALDSKYYEVLTQEIRKYGEVDYLSDHYPISAVISF